jgi:hypothetical protein
LIGAFGKTKTTVHDKRWPSTKIKEREKGGLGEKGVQFLSH